MSPSADDLLQDLDWVRGLAARLVFDGSQRDDLEQEIWHAALRRAPADGVALRSWLTGIGKHLAARLWRSDRRRERRELAAVRTGDAASAAELAERAELQERLLAAVNALPAEMRDVVLLRHFEALPPRAIAQRLGVPVATVRTRLQRAHERLRERLDADFGDRRTWVLAFAVLPRPRHVAAAAGAFSTVVHLGLATMQAHKLLAAAAVFVLAAIPTALVLARRAPYVGPDYGSAAPVAQVLESRAARPAEHEHTADPARTAAPATAALSGRVVDQHGAPIADAVLRPWPQWRRDSLLDDGVATAADVEVRTGSDGAFVLSPRIAGKSKAGAMVCVEHARYVPKCERTTVAFAQPATIVMLRTHEVPLEVEVVERTSRVPPPRFRVFASTSWLTGEETNRSWPQGMLRAPDDATGRDGRWRGTARFVEGLPLDVFVHCAGHGRGEWWERSDPMPRLTLHPTPDTPLQVAFEVDFDQAERLAPRVQRGRVCDAATGQPIAGATVSTHVTMTRAQAEAAGIARGESSPRAVQSRADGTFAVALPRDGSAAMLRIEHDDYQCATASANAEQETVFRLPARSSLRVRVVDDNGLGVPRAHVLVCARGDGRFHERRRTDEQGAFALERLLADRYTVFVVPRAGDPDERALASGNFTVGPAQQLDVTLPMQPPDAVRVTGLVVGGPDGLAPIFVPCAAGGRWTPARTQGRSYDAGALARGDYLVVLTAANDDERHLPTMLLPGVRVQGIGTAVIDLQVPTGTVRGRVLTSKPTAALRVVAVPALPPTGLAAELLAGPKVASAAGAALAADGSFELAWITDGAGELQLRDGATVVTRRAIQVRGALELGDWTIDR